MVNESNNITPDGDRRIKVVRYFDDSRTDGQFPVAALYSSVDVIILRQHRNTAMPETGHQIQICH